MRVFDSLDDVQTLALAGGRSHIAAIARSGLPLAALAHRLSRRYQAVDARHRRTARPRETQ